MADEMELKVVLVPDASKLKGALGGVGGKAGGGAGGGVGMGGALAAGAAGGLAVGAALKIVDVLKEMSPALGGTFKILGQALRIFFMPFGNFLSLLLRPMAVLLMRMAIGFLKWMQGLDIGKDLESAGENLAEAGEALAQGDVVGFITNLGEAAFDLGTAFAKILDSVLGTGTFFQGLVVGLGQLLNLDFEGLARGLGEFLGGILEGVNQFIADLTGVNIGELIGGVFQGVFDFAGWLGGEIDKLVVNVGDWTGNLVEKLTEFAESAGNWIDEKLIQPIANFFTPILDAVKNFVNGLIEAFNSLIRGINSLLQDLANVVLVAPFGLGSFRPFGFLEGFRLGEIPLLQRGGDIEKTGVAIVHKGERVLPAGKTGFGDIHVTINEPRLALDTDITEVARRVSEQIMLELSRTVRV